MHIIIPPTYVAMSLCIYVYINKSHHRIQQSDYIIAINTPYTQSILYMCMYRIYMYICKRECAEKLAHVLASVYYKKW